MPHLKIHLLFSESLASRGIIFALFKEKVGKGSVWKMSGNEIFVIMKPGLAATDLHLIVKMSPKVVVMLDESFVPEALKTNARAIFKDAKIELKTF